MNGAVCVVYPYPHPESNPTLLNFIGEMARRNTQVDLYCSAGLLRGSRDGGGRYLMESAPILSPVPRQGGRLPSRLAERVRSLALPLLHRRADRRYDAVVGVDPLGLTLARKVFGGSKVPLAYISFEIMFQAECTAAERPLKEAELRAVPDVQLVLVQDEERAEALSRETGLERALMELVPNAPAPQDVPRSDYLRESLGISAEKRIVLYAGGMGAWTSLYSLDELLASLPEEFVLVLHGARQAGPLLQAYLNRLSGMDNLVLSSTPLPPERLPELYASADYGLAPYMHSAESWASGSNVHHMGLSSGKVAYYAMCGLPVLARELPVYTREFASCRFGETYGLSSRAGEALERMEADYAAYSAEARRFYAERLDPAVPLGRFCDRLTALRSRGDRR